MMNPEKLVEDLFDDKNFADYKLRGFSQDHLLRLSIPANNPGGIYSTLITDTGSKFTAFFGAIDSELVQESINEGLTITTEETKAAAIAELSHLEGLVAFKFGKTSAIYQQFYPQGLSEYHDANLDQLPPLFNRYKTAANTHLLAGNPAEVAALIVKLDAYNNARNAQLTGFGTTSTLQAGRREDRKALTLQLTTNLLTIALNNLQNPDNYNNYYNPSYLPLTEEATSISGLINTYATITAVTEGVITQSSNLTFYNNGTEGLIYSINDQPGVIHPQYQISINPGNHLRYTETLPVFEKYYVVIQNPSGVANGKWKVVIG